MTVAIIKNKRSQILFRLASPLRREQIVIENLQGKLEVVEEIEGKLEDAQTIKGKLTSCDS
jgi:glycine cleavage system regulatory protein